MTENHKQEIIIITNTNMNSDNIYKVRDGEAQRRLIHDKKLLLTVPLLYPYYHCSLLWLTESYNKFDTLKNTERMESSQWQTPR